MPGLEYLIGDPITEFPENGLPTLRNVLCYYSQYWGSKGSDSLKEKMVARELIQIYQRQNLPVLNEKTVKDKVKKNVCGLKTILKFKSKSKTAGNIETERVFRSHLEEIFDIHGREIQTERTSDEPRAGTSSSLLEFNGISLFFRKCSCYSRIKFVYFYVSQKIVYLQTRIQMKVMSRMR